LFPSGGTDLTTLKQRLGTVGRSVLGPASERLFRSNFSYSAAGEDRLIISWLQYYGLKDFTQIRYCDIGAAHPKQLSNTFALYLCGARGVLVEPDPDQAIELRRVRPRDIVLNVGAAFDDQRSATLRRFTSRVFNTYSQKQADIVLEGSRTWPTEQRQHFIDEVQTELIPANDIIRDHLPGGYHLLSIDVEGFDFQILQSIDFERSRPKIICAELSKTAQELTDLLRPSGYELAATTPDNAIFRLK
jgi:FkbM family methyltransferase